MVIEHSIRMPKRETVDRHPTPDVLYTLTFAKSIFGTKEEQSW